MPAGPNSNPPGPKDPTAVNTAAGPFSSTVQGSPLLKQPTIAKRR